MAGVLLVYECIISRTHVAEFILIYVLCYWATSNLRICFVYRNNVTWSEAVIVHKKRKIFTCLTPSSDACTRRCVQADASASCLHCLLNSGLHYTCYSVCVQQENLSEQFAFQPGKIAIWVNPVKWAGSYFQWSLCLLLNT